MELEVSGKGKYLKELLPPHIVSSMEWGCAGHGKCGKCKVRLTGGTWETDGHTFTAPPAVTAKACKTRLLSDTGSLCVNQPGNTGYAGTGELADTLHFPRTSALCLGIDLGTTAIAAAALQNGSIAGETTVLNPQAKYGDNVFTRISFAAAGGLPQLRSAALEAINRLVDDLENLAGCKAERIAICGNTVMSCILHGIDPTSMGCSPFTPPCLDFPVLSGRQLGLNTDCPVLTAPCISAFIGGDLTAGLGEITLEPGDVLADLGTNCEILLNNGHGILGTAAPAGPAFEGAGLSCAVRAIPGAITHINRDFSFTMLGEAENPAGLCGSALLDFLAVARAADRLTSAGRLKPPAPSFKITENLSITEKEIEELLKAKAAIAAGLKTLTEHSGTEIKRIYLAGAFAKHLNTDSALTLGLLPPADFIKTGNSSLAGALRLAAVPDRLEELTRLSRLPKALNLNNLPGFQDNYIDALFLP